VAWITPQHQAGSVAYLWCVVQRFPKTGETVQVGERVAVQFTAADELKRRFLDSKNGNRLE
ncbi:hypothetical protein ABQF09_22430, partial [Xanthomonas campestris pv. campestris]|nr:hypothetical protein [Xanthomonas campestris pv. campestris]MEB1998412.1 hypothetical protein [Xanthomonas campestris pv. campestris]MEB2006938.1 hypothetical protein [Xanthomonas campestris pv. campestris]MEB2142590.1 hypothetical protein [Xanthomonas campestris pv. campestris]MEB2159577.1 hypothetical protein [Xanthomonas campestris pv. campestris]